MPPVGVIGNAIDLGFVVGRASTAASNCGVYYGVSQAAGPGATGAFLLHLE